jgi:hypothetical protein
MVQNRKTLSNKKIIDTIRKEPTKVVGFGILCLKEGNRAMGLE